MKDKQIQIIAAVVALVYIGIQSFQWYVFGQFPAPASLKEELLQGYHPLHVARSWLMLLAMFGLLFLYHVICSIAARINDVWARFAFLGFFVFLILEIILRSTELFYVQQHLPALALKSSDEALQGIINQFQAFQSIQQALYFPLIFSGFISYIILFFLFGGKHRVNRIIRFVMAVNILRVLWRLLSDYGNVHWLQGNLYDRLYLPLVVLLFGLTALWLIRYREEN